MEGLVPVGRTPILQSGGTSSWGGGWTPNPYTSGGWKTPQRGPEMPNPWKGAGHRSIQVPKPQPGIRMRKRVGGGQLGHLLVH